MDVLLFALARPCYDLRQSHDISAASLSLSHLWNPPHGALTVEPPAASQTVKPTAQHPCQSLRDALCRDGVYDGPSDGPGRATVGTGPLPREWRVATTPFPLDPGESEFLRDLGRHLLDFYRALNRLYLQSLRGGEPPWVAGYLDQGKPDWLVTYARMKRFRDELPGVIRPDLIATENGMVITELDSVPGGIGLTGSLSGAYAEATPSGHTLIGGVDGMVRGFAAMLQDKVGDRAGCIAIVVSEESRDYRPEMEWMARRLRASGLEAYCADPRDLRFNEESLLLPTEKGLLPVALVYRFFELFDLMNIPKAELIMYAAKKDRVIVTPPFKPALEEKLALALLHHPILAPFWRRELGESTWTILRRVVPHTWLLDPSPVPPTAVIPGLQVGDRPVADWRALAAAGQKDRRYVVKPSGFSELAWGSRGVSIGHDLAQPEWAATLDRALSSFPTTPYVLQEFHKGRQVESAYYDMDTCRVVPMAGRVRLSPYYFVRGGEATLGGVLATLCPLDKKVIHGMRDAIMAPCSEKKASEVPGSTFRA